ncbi:MAG TPA: nucleotidyl transferase AbiEii/AbiGii toxin family protein [Gammaproteobacteria bacterium]|nr:nucleotidyl transferase AbiEii/AbiGii toxin family protein [Gammaproteobacteria bacterium]
MQLFEALAQILSRLDAHGAPAAVLGGLAVSAWTEPRFTRDVDLAVAVQTDAEAERIVRQLCGEGYRLLATVEQTAAGRLATARLLPPGESEEGMIVDLLFASSGIEPEIVDVAAQIDIGAATAVRVARVGHLVALKLLAHDPITRPQDGLDLRALKGALDSQEEQRARSACELITQRGYHRGRDLRGLLDAFLAG